MGAAFAERLARDGHSVIVVDINDASNVVERIVSSGGRASGLVCDLGSPSAVDELGSEVARQFGGADILVNCAGIFPQASFEETTLEMWQNVIRVNLTSAFLLCKAFVPGMALRRFGRVINISSRTFWIPSSGYTAYIASKAGIIGLARAIASEYGRYGVTANVVAPGLTRTETSRRTVEPERFELLAKRQAIPKVGEPGDVVGAVSFLASQDSSYMTGQTMMVEGGWVRL